MKIKTRARQVIQFNYSRVTVNKQIPKVLHFLVDSLIDLTDLTFHVLPNHEKYVEIWKKFHFFSSNCRSDFGWTFESVLGCCSLLGWWVDTHERENFDFDIMEFVISLTIWFKFDVMLKMDFKLCLRLAKNSFFTRRGDSRRERFASDLCELNAFHEMTEEKLQRSWKLFDPRRCKLHHIKCWDMLRVDLRNFRLKISNNSYCLSLLIWMLLHASEREWNVLSEWKSLD